MRGHAVLCPCCGRTWLAFAPATNHPGAICPGCGAHERHRGLAIYLRERTPLGRQPQSLLHFAPERALREPIARLDGVDYVTADLNPKGVDVAADITALPFEDATFDGVLCSHVLEHVPDDRRAMTELKRVLRPDGWLLVLVPLDFGRSETYEDPAITSPEDRLRAFGQHDHVRMYAPDIVQRLESAGFEVRMDRLVDLVSADEGRRLGLLDVDVVFNCRVRHPAHEH